MNKELLEEGAWIWTFFQAKTGEDREILEKILEGADGYRFEEISMPDILSPEDFHYQDNNTRELYYDVQEEHTPAELLDVAFYLDSVLRKLAETCTDGRRRRKLVNFGLRIFAEFDIVDGGTKHQIKIVRHNGRIYEADRGEIEEAGFYAFDDYENWQEFMDAAKKGNPEIPIQKFPSEAYFEEHPCDLIFIGVDGDVYTLETDDGLPIKEPFSALVPVRQIALSEYEEDTPDDTFDEAADRARYPKGWD